MDVLLDDFFYSALQNGLNGIYNNDLNSIIGTIDLIDSRISNADYVLGDPYLSQNEQIVVNNVRLKEIYTQYRLLFDVYRVYLEQTGTNTNYATWLNIRNSSSPFNNDTPADYVNRQQPIWYVARDMDGDGVTDEIAPEVDGSNRTKDWTNSTTQSASLYRMIRGAVDPSGGSFSGRILPKSKNLRGKSKYRRFRESGGTVYTDDGKEFDPGGYYEEWELDYLNDPVGGGGPGSDPRESFGDNFFDPINRGGGVVDDYNYGGGRPTEEAIRRQRLLDEYRRTGGRSLTGAGGYGRINLGGDTIGRLGTSLRSGISNVRIPILPLGQSGSPLSNALNVTPMMAPMGAAGAAGAGGYGETNFMSSPLSSIQATPELYYSAPGLSLSGNPLGTNSSVFVGGGGAPGGGDGGTALSFVNLGSCNPNDIIYSFKLRRIRFVETKRFFGFNIKSAPQLEVILLAACPGQVGTPVISFIAESSIHYAFSPTSRGEFNIIGSPNSSMNSVGKIKYQYYFDFAGILNTMLNRAANTGITASETIYQNIRRRITNGGRPFVNVNTGVLSVGEPQARKDEFFKQNGNISTGFITTLPRSIQDVGSAIPLLWYADSTIPPNGMNLVENFFFMGNKDSVLSYADVSTSTSVDGVYDRTDRIDKSITSLINSKEGGEVESSGGTGSGTGGTGGGTGGGTPISSDKIRGSYKNNRYDLSWEFNNPGTRDCSAPSYFTNMSTNGQMWFLRIDDQFGTTRYEYPSALTSQNLLDLNSINPTDGSITGNIIEFLRNNSNLTPKEIQTRYGLIPLQSGLRGAPIQLPNNPCLTGVPVPYTWGVQRIKKIPIKIFCGNTEINYRVPGPIRNWMIAQILSNPSAYPARQDAMGNLLTNEDGYFYIEGSETVSLRGRFDNEPGPNWVQYEGVEFVQSNAGCNPVETIESEWKVDLDNPCGCDEVEVLTHYLTYPEITFKNPTDEAPTVFRSQRIKNERKYPEPILGSREASYNLRAGQELTTNRRQKPDCFETTGEGRLHHPFLYGTDILPGMRKKSIKGLFNLSQSLECYHTSSNQSVSQKEYYYEITDCDNCEKTAYFAVSYGNYVGSGSLPSGYELNDSPSRAIYSQYRLLALDPHEKQFTFYDGGEVNTADDIYVINFYRNGLSDKIDIGNFELNFAELNGSSYSNNVYTGSNVQVSSSNKILTLIDNSSIFDHEDVCANDDPNYSYDIVSGSLSAGIHSSGQGTLSTNTNLTTYGTVYPNLGIIVLDGHKLNVSASFNSVTGSSVNGDNSYKLFTAISGAAVLNKPMRARNVKFKTTNHYFVRIPSGEANYSNNPTYVVDSGDEKGRIKNLCFVDNPMTYITTIGLYNTKKELIAVAKLSKPIKKTKENDILVKIRLNW